MRHRYVYAIQEEGTYSMQLDATRMYILCRPWMAHDGNCTRAHATSVTARGAEWVRARLVPSRGFLIEPVQKVLSRIRR